MIDSCHLMNYLKKNGPISIHERNLQSTQLDVERNLLISGVPNDLQMLEQGIQTAYALCRHAFLHHASWSTGNVQRTDNINIKFHLRPIKLTYLCYMII